MSTPVKKTKPKRHKKNGIKDLAIVTLLVVIALICLIYLIRYKGKLNRQELEYEKLRQQEQIAEETEQTEVTEEIDMTESVPETETEEVLYCEPVYDFEELRQQNKDIYAWITIPGTKVDYPIVQSETDNYYLDINLDGSKGYPGCIYTNACNQKDFSDYNTVIYGHNMKNKTMFGSLHSFEDAAFFEENDTIYVYTEEKRLTYEVKIAVKYTDAYLTSVYAVERPEGRDSFLADLTPYLDSSIAHVRGDLQVEENAKLITLSTCVAGEGNRRYLVIGSLLEEAYYKE